MTTYCTSIHSLHTNNLTRFSWEHCATVWTSDSFKADTARSKAVVKDIYLEYLEI